MYLIWGGFDAMMYRGAPLRHFKTTKMASADVERSVESAIMTVNKLDGIFSIKEEQTTALNAFVDEKDAICCTSDRIW